MTLMGMHGRILRAVGAGLVGQVLNIGGRLLLLPLFLTLWGAQAYGEWLIMSSATMWLAVADLGGQVYFVNRLTAEWTRNAQKEFERTLATGFVFFLIVGCLLLLFALISLNWPIAVWLGIVATPHDVVTIVLLLLAFQIAISLPQGLLLGIFRAVGAQATSTMLGNAILVFQMIASCMVLLLGGGMVAMAVVQILPVLAVSGWAAVDLRVRLRGIRLFAVSLASADVARQAFRPSLNFFGIQLAQAVVIQGSVLTVGHTLGAVDVAIFSTARMLVNLAKQFLGLISHSAWPEFTRLEAAQDTVGLSRLFKVVLRVSMLVAIAYVAVIETAGQELMGAWLRGQLTYDAGVVRLFSIYILFSVFGTVASNVLMATNRHITLARWQLAGSLIALAMCYAGTTLSGLSGGTAGLIIGEAVPLYAIGSYLLARQNIGVSARSLLQESLLLLVPAFLALRAPMAAVATCVILGWLTWNDRRGKHAVLTYLEQ